MPENESLDPLVQTRRIIGRNLAACRAYQRMTQQDVARSLRIGRQRLSDWENGDRPIPSEYVPHLARLYSVRIESIYREPQE